MEPLLIAETVYTPKVDFQTDGNLSIVGKSLPEDTSKFYQPLVDWISECTLPKLDIIVRLDYMNTSSSKEIYLFFKCIRANDNIKKAIVNWYYEEGDDDMLDLGIHLKSFIKAPFNFIENEPSIGHIDEFMTKE